MNLSDALFVVTMQASRGINEKGHRICFCDASLEHMYVFLCSVYCAFSQCVFLTMCSHCFPRQHYWRAQVSHFGNIRATQWLFCMCSIAVWRVYYKACLSAARRTPANVNQPLHAGNINIGIGSDIAKARISPLAAFYASRVLPQQRTLDMHAQHCRYKYL